ncbi:MAG: rod shape-determining protein MreC [Candidatus Sulfotelmatobacter sp.]
MESVLGRYRNLTILVGVLFLQVLGLAVQVKRSGDSPEHTRLIRIWAVDTVTPFERVLVWAQNSSANLWHNYFFLRGVRAENRQLKQQIEQMRLEQVRLSEDADQAHRLQQLLGFREQFVAKTVPAQVIGSGGSDLSRIIYIDKGGNDGIKRDFAVITANGIVGKVLEVFPSVSQVLLINDQTSGVGAMLEKSRLQGVLKGTPDGEVVLQRVMSDEKVAPGDLVLSSGGDRIFPKGLPVGTVSKVSPGHEMFLNIQVKPAADLSRLEEVLVVTQKQEEDAVVESGTRLRAADILAQRLPSVPDKPAATSAPGLSTGAKPMGVPEGLVKPKIAQRAATTGALGSSPGEAGTMPTTNANAVTPSKGQKPPAAASPPTSGAQTSDVPKQAPAQTVSKGPALNMDAGSRKTTASDPAASTTPPVTSRPKAPVSQPSPPPPAVADDPH